MAEVVLTEAAQADLDEIDRYGREQFGDEAADAYAARFFAAFERLAAHPLIGHARPDVRSSIRYLGVGRHHLYYSVADNDRVVVRRILHHAMDARRRI